MTISKSQGQTLNLLIYICHLPFFPHGQLYVAFPRLFSFDSVTVSLTEGHRRRIEKERLPRSNTVYNNIYLLQLGCHPVAVVILHVNKT